MKSYSRLVNFEISRFLKFYLILIGLIIAFQLIGAIIKSKEYVSYTNKAIYEEQIPVSQYIEQYGTFPFQNYINSVWFTMPIFFCIAILMIYVFFIWYRDWFGKNTFIYRLLMLPTERISIYFAKLTAIMLMVLGLISLQILLMPIEIQIINSIIPTEFRTYLPFNEIFKLQILYYLYPNTFTDFILIYGLGLILVAVLFTAILLERSYRLIGIFFAIVYVILSFGIFISPLLLDAFYTDFFYPLEIFGMVVVTSIIVLVSAICIANQLLKYKIRV